MLQVCPESHQVTRQQSKLFGVKTSAMLASHHSIGFPLSFLGFLSSLRNREIPVIKLRRTVVFIFIQYEKCCFWPRWWNFLPDYRSACRAFQTGGTLVNILFKKEILPWLVQSWRSLGARRVSTRQVVFVVPSHVGGFVRVLVWNINIGQGNPIRRDDAQRISER